MVADAGNDWRRLAQRGDTALDGLEIVAAQRSLDGELEERTAALDELLDGGVPPVLA